MSNSHSSHHFRYTKNVRFNSPETNYEELLLMQLCVKECHSYANEPFKRAQIVQ